MSIHQSADFSGWANSGKPLSLDSFKSTFIIRGPRSKSVISDGKALEALRKLIEQNKNNLTPDGLKALHTLTSSVVEQKQGTGVLKIGTLFQKSIVPVAREVQQTIANIQREKSPEGKTDFFEWLNDPEQVTGAKEFINVHAGMIRTSDGLTRELTNKEALDVIERMLPTIKEKVSAAGLINLERISIELQGGNKALRAQGNEFRETIHQIQHERLNQLLKDTNSSESEVFLLLRDVLPRLSKQERNDLVNHANLSTYLVKASPASRVQVFHLLKELLPIVSQDERQLLMALFLKTSVENFTKIVQLATDVSSKLSDEERREFGEGIVEFLKQNKLPVTPITASSLREFLLLLPKHGHKEILEPLVSTPDIIKPIIRLYVQDSRRAKEFGVLGLALYESGLLEAALNASNRSRLPEHLETPFLEQKKALMQVIKEAEHGEYWMLESTQQMNRALEKFPISSTSEFSKIILEIEKNSKITGGFEAGHTVQRRSFSDYLFESPQTLLFIQQQMSPADRERIEAGLLTEIQKRYQENPQAFKGYLGYRPHLLELIQKHDPTL